jgi:hypothetical protein
VSFTIKSQEDQVGIKCRPKVESDFRTVMNKTPIVIVIVAILVLCCCSTCALACTLYFFSKVDNASRHEEWVSNVGPKAAMNDYVDEYGCASGGGHTDERGYSDEWGYSSRRGYTRVVGHTSIAYHAGVFSCTDGYTVDCGCAGASTLGYTGYEGVSFTRHGRSE